MDPRFDVGAYISDGIDLYEVVGSVKTSGYMGVTVWHVKLENCRTLLESQFTRERVREAFELVKAAPSAAVPDDVEHIAWEAA